MLRDSLLLRLHQRLALASSQSVGRLGTVAFSALGVRDCVSGGHNKTGSNSASGWSIKEAFPEEVAPKEVEDALTWLMSKGQGWGTLRQREQCTWSPEKEFGKLPVLQRGCPVAFVQS